ncbi:hypothetical protein [Paenibacillus xerothermodurans]|uniref:Uncharacterized protein n=1 Tax=Paenibacillus xerothermodurans TaxID=1977292 RepID=A0A2W1NG89_PAEXE|nr:hypothetical protein [Paenibacillus xerothermodurans]PZE22700.1 hypothetical protein CBW46_002740 [Paenibacillus xerothermodurans]
MDVIEFFLKNWYFAILLYFLLSGLVKQFKSDGDKAQKSTPKAGMPPFGGGGAGWGRPTAAPTVTTTKPAAAASGEASHTAGAQLRRDSSEAAAAQGASRGAPQAVAQATAGHSEGELSERDFWQSTEVQTPPPADPQRSRYLLGESGRSAGRSAGLQSALDSERLAQGVLWAEILGPPKSKRHLRK